mgnify:CR=1 FL=1
MKQWEMDVEESRKNLWLVTTEKAKYLCVKFKSRFLIKDGGAMLPVKESVVSIEQL